MQFLKYTSVQALYESLIKVLLLFSLTFSFIFLKFFTSSLIGARTQVRINSFASICDGGSEDKESPSQGYFMKKMNIMQQPNFLILYCSISNCINLYQILKFAKYVESKVPFLRRFCFTFILPCLLLPSATAPTSLIIYALLVQRHYCVPIKVKWMNFHMRKRLLIWASFMKFTFWEQAV